MKLFNVHGDMFDAGKEFPTQDIEFNSHPTLELANAKTTKEIVDLRVKYAFSDPDEYFRQLEKRDDTEMQKKHDQHPPRPVQSIGQYSQTAYRFGDYVCKYRLIPNTETQRSLANKTIKPEDGADVLHRCPIQVQMTIYLNHVGLQ